MDKAKEKLIQLAYILGVALILSGLIYFFAANWQGFSIAVKVTLSMGVMLLFYGLSYGFFIMFPKHQFLSRLLLFAGCFAFGISVALVGQIYNSHANSYVLFLVWFIASLLFSICTRYQPLYILSYILIHLSVWFYFFPEGSTWSFGDGYIYSVLSVIILININTFLLIEKKWLYSPYAKLLSYIASHVVLIWISMKFFLEPYFLLTNLVYVIILAGCFYYFLRIQQQNKYLTITGISTLVFLIIKYIELLVEHFGPPIFIATIILGVVAVYANIYIVKKVMGNVKSNQQERGLVAEIDQGQTDDARRTIWKNLATVLFTVLSSIVITVSLTLLVTDVIGDFESLAVAFFFMGLLLFLLPGIYSNKRNEVIGGTLISIGYLMSSIAVLQIATIYFFAWIIMIVIGLAAIRNNGVRNLLYALAQIIVTIKLYMDWISEFAIVCLVMIAINIAVVLVFKYKNQFFKEQNIAESLYKNSFFYALLFFFILTFIEGSGYQYGLYIVYNILFFVLATMLVFWSKNNERSYEFRVSIAFWFAFLFYKYYDFVWQLLHKSIALLILGLLFVLVANWFERKNIQHEENNGEVRTSDNITASDEVTAPVGMWEDKKKTMILIGLILLQVAFLGAQIGLSEYALANGQQVKLKLEPVDPRSIMQGDYVVLNYTISQLGNGRQLRIEPREVPDSDRQDMNQQELERQQEEWERQWQEEWEDRWDKDYRDGQRIQVVLTLDEDGIHQYKEIYEGQDISESDIIINGTYRGWRVLFGIESYFVPEGTGLDVEASAKYAYVRISKNGNAILERLSEK